MNYPANSDPSTKPEKVRSRFSFVKRPLLAPLLERRLLAAWLGFFVVIQGCAIAFGFQGWSCPAAEVLHVPCPGCGMSRAISAFLTGDWSDALRLHAFAPVVSLGVGFVLIAALLPLSQRRELIRWVSHLEQKTGIAGLCLLGLVVYWIVRLTVCQEFLFGLIQE